MSKRQLAVVSRTDLSFFEGWDGCYIEWQPATYLQAMKVVQTDYKNITEDEAQLMIIALVKERMIGGKVKILGEDGKPELVDVTEEDIDSMPSTIVDRLYVDMAGLKYDADPLDAAKTETASSTDSDSTKPQTPTSNTETA